jgi:E1-like protein-activating enzyme Gsa7p/Apg7p
LKKFNQKSGKLFYMKGIIAHYSTIESFNKLSNHDKLVEYLQNKRDQLPAFILFIFGDLKNYTFTYSLHEINNEIDLQIKKLVSFEKIEEAQKLKLMEISKQDNIIKHEESDSEILKYYSSAVYNIQDDQQYLFLYDITTMPTNIPNFFKISLKEKILNNEINIKESGQSINIILIKNISSLSKSVVLSVHISHKTENSFCTLILNKSDLKIHTSDLKQMFDPLSIAENAVDLNINLMKWRMAPDINVEIIKNIKFLLVGSGTLGCHVARNLLGWGARNINFLDSGKVSYSNPVRQSLYTFKDSSECNNFKSIIASQKLKEIFPMVNSEGYNLQIPLPSRALVNSTAEESYLNTVKNLEDIISEHDVIFLLTDSRESRWYPTMIAKSMNKKVITAAIGFDSFLVMRHGNDENNLGCYFCNDIISPIDTSSNRTLDQQCTISRPGISSICSGFASEMAISILQKDNSLGQNVPKSIRGNLTDYNFVCIDHARFKK